MKILSLLLAALPLSAPGLATAGERPNIIVIMVDDMGVSDIGAYGSEIPTPHLDSLAANGVRFSQFYNTGRCCPTRASLLTGLYSHQTGIGWMTSDQGAPGYRGQLNDQCVTIAEALNPSGYLTAMTGKWHVGFEHGVTPKSRGFQRSLNLAAGGLHFSDQTGSKGGAELYLNGEEIARDDPQFNPPWYGSDLWTEQGIEFIDEALAEQKPFFLYLAHIAPHFPCMAPEATIAKYRGKYKHYNHEGGIASPLIAHWPAEVSPRPGADGWIDTPTHLIDLMATCVDLSGADYPQQFAGKDILPMEGRSLRPLLTGNGEFAERPLFWEHEGNAAIRVGDRKLVRAGEKGPWELFDLKVDRSEHNDLATTHPDEVQALDQQWQQWAERVHALPKPGPGKKSGKGNGKAKGKGNPS